MKEDRQINSNISRPDPIATFRFREDFSGVVCEQQLQLISYKERTRRKPSSMDLTRCTGRLPHLSIRNVRSTLITCDTFATESIYARHSASPFDENYVSPSSGKITVGHLADLLTSSDLLESILSYEAEARGILREDSSLQCP